MRVVHLLVRHTSRWLLSGLVLPTNRYAENGLVNGGFAWDDYGYFVPYYNTGGNSGKMARVELANFSQVQVLDLASMDADLRGFQGGFASGGYGYLVPYNNFDPYENYFGKVVRMDLREGEGALSLS